VETVQPLWVVSPSPVSTPHLSKSRKRGINPFKNTVSRANTHRSPELG